MPRRISLTKKELIVGDTSALISLNAAGLLLEAKRIADIFVPREVESELSIHARFSMDAADALNLIRQGVITVCDVQDKEEVERLLSQFRQIDRGEAEAVVLAQEKNIQTIITDDFEALPHLLQIATVQVHLSAYLIAGLVRRGFLSLDTAFDVLEQIARKRNWRQGELYQHAKRYLEVMGT